MRCWIWLISIVGGAAVLCSAAGQEKSNQTEQSLQNIERPNRTWDYDGKRILGHVGEQILLWDATTGKLLLKLKGHKERLFALRFSWGGTKEVEPGLGLYEMSTGQEVARLQLAEWGHLIGFAPDGRTLLVGGSEFVIYDAANGKCIRTLKLLDEVSFAHDWNR